MEIGSGVILGIVLFLLFMIVEVVRLEERFGSWLSGGDETGKEDSEGQKNDNVWRATYQNIPLKFFGGGANHNFDYYFTRRSDVSVSSIDEIMQWLLGCEYVSDPEQFNVRDHWQHPVDFESTRKGDCEDFALWAWRKLVEMGHDAEFMVGKWIHDGRVGTHAWVLLQHEEQQYIFESTGRAPERILKDYSAAHESYVPFAAVDHKLRKKVYQGMLHWVMNND